MHHILLFIFIFIQIKKVDLSLSLILVFKYLSYKGKINKIVERATYCTFKTFHGNYCNWKFFFYRILTITAVQLKVRNLLLLSLLKMNIVFVFFNLAQVVY